MRGPIDLHDVAMREREAQGLYRCRVMCCNSSACLASGAGETREVLETSIQEAGLGSEVQVVPTGCMGLCSRGPLVRVNVRGETPTLYAEVSGPEAHALAGQLLQSEVSTNEAELTVLPPDLPFFSCQECVVLANMGEANPARLEDYVARGGYLALEKALQTMTSLEVVNEIRASGLRGRGSLTVCACSSLSSSPLT